MPVFDADALSPYLIQDRDSLTNGNSEEYSSSSYPDKLSDGLQDKTFRIQVVGTGDVDVVFLDEGGADLPNTLNVQGGEDYSYDFANKHTYPDGLRLDANADSDYLLIIERS